LRKTIPAKAGFAVFKENEMSDKKCPGCGRLAVIQGVAGVFALILLICGVLYIKDSQAAEVTLSLGASQFSAVDGIWWQSENPHTLNLKSPSGAIRVDSEPVNGWSLGFGYLYLGKTAANAVASADDGLSPDAPGYDPLCTGQCWPKSHWTGYGDVKGVFLEVRKQFERGWFVEGGAYMYRPTWQEYIPDWRACATCAPQYLEISHEDQVKVSPIYAVGYRQGAWSVSVQQVWVNANKFSWPALYDRATTSMYMSHTW
jgi:hypothetical protein